MFAFGWRSLALVPLLFSTSVFAGLIVNGDFSTNDGWHDASFSGSVDIFSGIATLSTAPNSAELASAVLVQGDDGFFTFFDPITVDVTAQFLNFDVKFSDLGADLNEGIFSIFDDYLSVNLYDAFDISFDLLFSSGVYFTQSSNWLHVSLGIASLAGREVALSFELNDEANGRDTSAMIDNLCLSSTNSCSAVELPEPDTVFLLILSLLGLSAARERA